MAYKTVMVALHLEDALDAHALSELRDEMMNWRDNMAGTPLENTGKFGEVSEAADALDGGVVDQIEAACERILALDGLDKVFDSCINVAEQRNTDKRRIPSRAIRCSNACAQIKSAIMSFQDLLESSDFPKEVDRHTLEESIHELEEAISEAEQIVFPSMF